MAVLIYLTIEIFCDKAMLNLIIYFSNLYVHIIVLIPQAVAIVKLISGFLIVV
jgi:hypothetical protein